MDKETEMLKKKLKRKSARILRNFNSIIYVIVKKPNDHNAEEKG